MSLRDSLRVDWDGLQDAIRDKYRQQKKYQDDDYDYIELEHETYNATECLMDWLAEKAIELKKERGY